MKILQVIHKIQNRGAETFACQLSNHLIHMGNNVKMVSLFDGNAILPYNGNIISIKSSPNFGILNLIRLKKLSDIIKDFQPDIIQVNSGDTLKFTVLSKIIFKWDFPIVSRNASEVGKYLKSPLQIYLNGLLYKQVKKVISVSKKSEYDILKIFPFLRGTTEVIPIGLENVKEIPLKDLSPAHKKHVIHVGGYSFEKNHLGLLRIFQKVLQKDSNVHLHLIGDGILKQEIEKEVKNKKLADKITFYGFVNDPLTYIKSADIIILPSIIEGLPGVLLEAMYCKTPVVAYDVGGISEIVNIKTGTLIEKNHEESFANAILNSLRRKNEDQISLAHKMVLDQYMNTHIAERFLEAYRKLN